MLLFFPGELMDRFLFWLREPPMATAESLSVSDLSQMLLKSLSPLKVHLCLSSIQPGSTSEPHMPCYHLTSQPLPVLTLLLLMLYNPNGQEYKYSHIALLLPRLFTLVTRSLSTHTHQREITLSCKRCLREEQECVCV